VGQRQRQHDTLRGHAAEPVGQIPQARFESRFDPVHVRDRHHRHDPARPRHRAAQQRGHHVGEAARHNREAPVEHRQPRRSDHPPRGLHRHRLQLGILVPWPQQVLAGEQLGAGHRAHADVVQDQPVEDEQAEGARVILGARLPRPDRQRSHPCNPVSHREVARVGGHRREELVVVFEDPDDMLPV
jgi:hypothetical protein